MKKAIIGFLLFMVVLISQPAPASAKVEVVEDGVMRNTPASINASTRDNARQAIYKLKYADLWGSAGTKQTAGNVRIDLQGTTSNREQNLQAQINGITGNSTIAAILVIGTLRDDTNTQRQSEVINNAHTAFAKSLDSLIAQSPHIYKVQGTFSN